MIFRKIHATTTNPPTYGRLLLIIVISYGMVSYIPYLGSEYSLFDFFSFNAVNIGLLFAIITGFLMMIMLTRKQALMGYISIELNKIRRIYHLGSNIAINDVQSRNWFQQLDTSLINYFDFFRTNDFREYEKGNDLFRRVTYTVYRLPQTSKSYNAELYTSLLDATSDATEAREQIRSHKDASIGFFQWASMVIVTASFALIVASATPPNMNARIMGGLVIFNLLLMLQLLYEYDRINKRKGKAIAQVYLQNEYLMRKDVEEEEQLMRKPIRRSKKPSS